VAIGITGAGLLILLLGAAVVYAGRGRHGQPAVPVTA
jgi:hypothetical protein